MNFYKHHIGDFDAATAHLSWAEDAAYRRLLSLYYRRELPIPRDVGQACRLVRASSKEERAAVDQVLREFFTLEDDGWHNRRCDAEIQIAGAKAERNREVGKLGGRPRKAAAQAEPTRNPDGFQNTTQTEPTRNPPQTPDSRLQTPRQNTGGLDSTGVARATADPPAPENEESQKLSTAGRACLACRGANVHDVNPQHPDLLRLIAAGVTPEEVGATAAECAARGKPRFAYVLATIERRRVEAAEKGAVPTAQAAETPDVTRDAKAFAAAMDDRAATATRPPAAILALAGKVGRIA